MFNELMNDIFKLGDEVWEVWRILCILYNWTILHSYTASCKWFSGQHNSLWEELHSIFPPPTLYNRCSKVFLPCFLNQSFLDKWDRDKTKTHSDSTWMWENKILFFSDGHAKHFFHEIHFFCRLPEWSSLDEKLLATNVRLRVGDVAIRRNALSTSDWRTHFITRLDVAKW